MSEVKEPGKTEGYFRVEDYPDYPELPSVKIVAEKVPEVALKYDSGLEKLSWSLMPFDAVEGMLRVLEYGRRKYSMCGNCGSKIYPNPRLVGGDPERNDCPACGSQNIHEGANNWRKGFAWTRLIDAAYRHLTAILKGEDIDPESNEPHHFHLMCCVAFMAEHYTRKLGKDDRFRYLTKGNE